MLEVERVKFLNKVNEVRTAAKARRRMSAHDVMADALDWCAAEFEEVVTELDAVSAWLTVDQYASLKLVTPQTVRGWIRKGELVADNTGHGYRIATGTERNRSPRRRNLRIHTQPVA